jgi:hypothetical protein
VALAAVVMSAAVAAPVPIEGQNLFRLGAEFHVNSSTGQGEGYPAVGRASDGRFVVVWLEARPAMGDSDIVGRRFDSLGQAIGSAFQVNVYTPGAQARPVLAVDSGGRFTVAWTNVLAGDASGEAMLRRYDANGVAQGGETQMNTYTFAVQRPLGIGTEADGGFVVVWQSNLQDGDDYGLFGRRFDSSGAVLGGEFAVNLGTTGNQFLGAVDMEPDGDFVVVWMTEEGNRIRGRRFTSSGAGGAEIAISTYTGGQAFPSVALDGAGNFVVAWTEATQIDGSGLSIFARKFNALGGAESIEFQVNSHTPYSQRLPAVDGNADGRFVVVWESLLQEGSGYGVFARVFGSTGQPMGPDFQVNSYTPSNQARSAVTLGGDDGFVVVWHSYQQNAGVTGVHAQRFALLAPFDVDGNGTFDALTDGLLILRFGFGFSGQTLISGAVGTGCTRCDPASIAAYMSTMI